MKGPGGRKKKRKIFPKLHGSVRNIYTKGGNSISLKMENNDELLGLKYLVSIWGRVKKQQYSFPGVCMHV